jgi:hypothetical protein
MKLVEIELVGHYGENDTTIFNGTVEFEGRLLRADIFEDFSLFRVCNFKPKTSLWAMRRVRIT